MDSGRSAAGSKSVEGGQDVQPSAFAMVTPVHQEGLLSVSGAPSPFNTQCQGRPAHVLAVSLFIFFSVSFHPSSSCFPARRRAWERKSAAARVAEQPKLQTAMFGFCLVIV